MKILFAASEVVPFIKTGGLADVAGALPKALRKRGHDVRIVLPRYGDLDTGRFRLLPMMPEMKVRYGNQTIQGSILRCNYPGTDMPVYFVDEPMFSIRRGVYGTGRMDFPDNDIRFAFFSMAVLWLLKGLDWQPDVIHANDWQTGLLPVLLRHHPEVCHDAELKDIKTVFSIHNLGFQGNFDKFVLPSIGLPWEVFTPDGMEFYGRASFLKGGITFSDAVVAVSPTYAEEIQTEEYGAGMSGTLQHRAGQLHGILNGIDTDEWNPEKDEHLPATFSANDLSGKAQCKEHLQELFHLPKKPDVPLFGVTARLVGAKVKLIIDALEDLLDMDAQFVILGTGDPKCEEPLLAAAKANPDRLAVRVAYDVPLSHKIVAGSDMFLVPSQYEPCGLTQMYSMCYGTVPVVRRTGGLSDSVRDANEKSIKGKIGTGFLFDEFSAEAFVKKLQEAIKLYKGNKNAWKQLMQNGMAQNFSWDSSAERYERVYEEVQ